MTPAQLAARSANGRRTARRLQAAATARRWAKAEQSRSVPLHLAELDSFRLPSLCRVYGPDGRLRVVLDPFTRQPMERR